MLYFCFYANFLSLTEDNSEFFIKVNFCKFRKIFTRYKQGVFNNCMSEVGARLTEGRRLSAAKQKENKDKHRHGLLANVMEGIL